MSMLTLRIKKVYFNQILAGEKKIEYREKSAFYDRIFKKKYDYIKLHYQKAEKLIAEFKNVKVVDNIYKKEKRPVHLKTEKVYAIHIKNPFLYNEIKK